MLTGYLRSKGVKASEYKVGKKMRGLFPAQQKVRSETAGRALNPKTYTAEYFGHKIHFDQNEKLAMYGVTHVLARDGFSGYITAGATMPIKNNLLIYRDVYRYIMHYSVSNTIISNCYYSHL